MASYTAVFAMKVNNGVVLAVDSRTVTGDFFRVLYNDADKFIQLFYRVYIACSGDFDAIDEFMQNVSRIRTEISGIRGASMSTVADSVRLEANQVIQRLRTGGNEQVKMTLILVGALNDNNYSIYTIAKNDDQHGGEYCARQAGGGLAIAGAGFWAMRKYCIDNCHRIGRMDIYEGTIFAFKCVRHAVKHDWLCGNRIQVMSIDSDSNLHWFEQYDPTNCVDRYHYTFGKYQHTLYDCDDISGDENSDSDDQPYDDNIHISGWRQFRKKIRQNDGLIIVQCFRSQQPGFAEISNVFTSLVEENRDILFLSLDCKVLKMKRICERLGFKSLPGYVSYRNGDVIGRYEMNTKYSNGMLPQFNEHLVMMRKWINRLMHLP